MMSTASTKRSSSGGRTNNEFGIEQLIDHIYIYDMPLTERRHLCMILDEQNVWEGLAYQMGYKKKDVDQIRYHSRNGSPSDELLSLWSDQNHTVTALFILLQRMQQYPAMDSIRSLVDSRYVILRDQPDLCALMSNQSLSGRPNTDKQGDNGKIESEIFLRREDNESSDMDSSIDGKSSKNASSTKSVMNNVNEYACTIPQIDYQELLLATGRWHKNNILGRGGFGTVFEGRWNCTDVAIKRIEYHAAGPKSNIKVQMQQSLNELRFLSSCRHDNVLPIFGYCINSINGELLIVCQLMTGGSLEKRLANTKTPLKARQRLNIAIGIARGLQYLHNFNKKPLIHGDIKPANILLEKCPDENSTDCSCECRHLKIGDFGLAREGSFESFEVSRVFGTKPYLPPDYLIDRHLSTKIDTYSFGVVLFEMATGLPAYDKDRGRHNAFLTKHIWAFVKGKENIDDTMDKLLESTPEALLLFKSFIQIGLKCTEDLAENRPEMIEVLKYLDIAKLFCT